MGKRGARTLRSDVTATQPQPRPPLQLTTDEGVTQRHRGGSSPFASPLLSFVLALQIMDMSMFLQCKREEALQCREEEAQHLKEETQRREEERDRGEEDAWHFEALLISVWQQRSPPFFRMNTHRSRGGRHRWAPLTQYKPPSKPWQTLPCLSLLTQRSDASVIGGSVWRICCLS